MATFWSGFKAEMVDSLALHVVHGGLHAAFHFAEEDAHCSAVGVGRDVDFGLYRLLIGAIERANKPVALEFIGCVASVFGRGAEPNGVFNIVEHVHLTAFVLFTQGLKYPRNAIL